MRRARCKVCRCPIAPTPDHRCRGCREAKAATDAGMTYGKFKAMLFDRFGDAPDLPDDTLVPCPECGRLYLPTHGNQRYCSHRCSQRSSNRRYRQRREGADGADPED